LEIGAGANKQLEIIAKCLVNSEKRIRALNKDIKIVNICNFRTVITVQVSESNVSLIKDIVTRG
jgi:hypothetical protein